MKIQDLNPDKAWPTWVHHEITNSSRIAKVSYCESKALMEIQFKKGGTYRYSNVTPDVFEPFIKAESIGKAFEEKFQKNPEKFPFKKI